MSKAYAKTRAEEKKKSSSASSQKKDKFQQAYEQGTEIYNQNRQNTIQEVRRLQQSLDATSGIAGKTASTARTYLDNLAAYRARLASLGMYGANVGRAYSQAGKTTEEVRSWLPALNQIEQEQQRQREIQAARNRRPWAERVGLVDPNEAEMTFGVYDPSASERGRMSNVAAAGGRGWLAGQANALGFALDPDQPDEAEMFFGKAPTSKLGEKISEKINQGLFNESQRLYGAADQLNAQAQENEAAAREGLGKVGNVLVDAGIAGTQMLLDASIGRATGTGMTSMGTRTFGQSAREALDSGASYQQAMDYGALSAAVEVGTEKMFDVGKVFGKGAGDELIEAWIAKHGKTAAGTTILRMLAGMGSEGLEEVVSSAVNPILRSGFDPDALKDYRTREYWADMLNEGLVGALLGGVGVAGNVITGGNARMRAEVEQRALNQRLERADAFNKAQREFFAGNTMQTGTADAEAQRVLNRNSGTVGEGDKAAVRTAARQQYGAQARAVESVYESGTADAETFLRQFETAYNLGREGANIETAMNTPATAGLNEQQRRNAWLIGRDVGVQAGEITEDTSGTPGSSSPTEIGGVQNNGEAIRVRGSSERDAGQSTAGSVQQVESGTGSYQEGRSLGIGEGASDSAAQTLRYSSEVKSARELGIENGAVIQNLRTVDETSYTPEMKEYADEQAEKGHRVVYLSGMIHAQDAPGGMVTRSRGMVNTNGDIFVQVDHPRFTAMQIARHEDAHTRIARGEIDLQKAKDAVRQSLGEEEYKRAVYDYTSAYAGIDMTDDEAFEEIVCDAEGGMNIFEGTALKKEYDRNAKIAEAARKAVRENAGEQKADGTRAPPEEKTKFSMEAPVEETDRLIAWHNMGVDALNGALELGGLAMPSWAIQPANKAHTQYGDVSVIAPRELVDPKRNRNSMIFGGDAWTPVFPEVNYKVSYEAAEALEDEIKALVGEDVYRQIGGAALDKDNIADQFKRSNGRLSGHYANNLLLKYAYLKSTGSDIEAPTKEDDLYYGGDFTNEDVRRFAGRLTNGKRTLEKLENMSVDELYEQDDLLQAIADVRRDSYREKLKGKEELLEKLEKSNLFSKEDIKFSTIDRMLKAARKYLDGGVQKTVDKKALQEILDREVDQGAYEAWILQKLSDTVERKGIRNNKDLFTPSGNRRSFDQLNYAYTLANIVKAMKAQPKQGRAQFFSGPGSVRGAAMKSYKDIEQARSEIGRVINAEEDSDVVNAAFDEYNENLSDILDRMTKNGDKFDAANAVIEILQHAKTESGIYNYMQRELKDWYNVSPEIAHDIYELIGQVNALPIPYFEGKTYDAVRLDEALAIVVPDTINADLKQRLEDAGANVREYKAGDKADRLRVVNSVEGAKFSREDNLSELRQENRELKRETDALTKAVQKWKRETKRTERYSAREEDVRRSAKDLIKTLNSTADAAEITADMKALTEYIMNGENGETASWLTVREMADRIADKVVGAEQVNIRGDVFNEYQRLTEILKGKTLHIDPDAVPDLQGYENLLEFNRANMGTMCLSAKEMKPGDKSVQDAYYEMIEAMPGWFPEDASTDAEMVANMLEVLDGLRPVYGMSDETSYHYDEAVTWAANDIIDRVLDESIRQMPKTFADKAAARLERTVAQERNRADQRVERAREVGERRLERQKSEANERVDYWKERKEEKMERHLSEQRDRFGERIARVRAQRDRAVSREHQRANERVAAEKERGRQRTEKAKWEYAFRSNEAMRNLRERQEKQIADLKAKQKAKEKNARERRGTTATWHKIQKIGAKFRQMAEHPAQAASKHAPRELAKALQNVADVFYTENRRRSNQTVNAAIQNLAVQFDALKDTEQGIYYDPMLAELNRVAEKALLNVPANEMTPEQIDAVYRLLRAHMKNITSANKFVTGKWAKTIWETGRDWAREVDGASPIMKGWTGDFLNWQLRPDSFFKRISGFAKDSVGERVQKMFSDGTEKMLRIQQDAYYTFREFTESKQFDRLSKRGKGDLVDVGLKDADGKPVLLTRDMMLAVYMNLRNEQNLQAATYGGIEVPNFDEYYTGRTNTSYRHRTTTMNVGGETLELQNERRDLEHSLRSGELSEEAAEEARTRLQEIEDEIRQRADEIVGQMLKVRSNIESELTDYEKRFADAAAEWMRKSADYLNAETMAMYGIEKAQVPNYWPLHRDLSFVNTDMRTIADEINLENVGFLKERVQSSAPIMLAGFTFELENHTRRVSEYCGFAAVQRDFNKLYNTKLTREGSSLERKIRDKFGDEQRKMGASGQQYIDAYIASVSGADKADATVFSLIRRNLPRATLTLNLRVAVSQLASMPTAAAEIGWGSAAKGLPRGLKTAFSRKAKAELSRKNPWFWQRYRGEGGMREFADMREERNWLDRTWNKFAGMPVVRNLVNWCQDFDVFATASMWAMSEEWVKSNTDYKPGTEEFDRAVGEKYADVIRRTQPNYTVTERSGLLRDKREGYKLLTMYKTQSNQNLNVLYDANATLIKYKKDLKAGRNGVTKEDVKAAQRQFARAYTAVILGGSVSFAILRAGANAILHAMNSYRDDDDEVTLESTLNGILSETASAMAGMFAFGSAVYDAVHALVSGEKYYGLNESAIEALSNLAEQSMTIAQKAIDRDKDVEQKDVEKLAKNACNILGLPWNNARTIVEGVVNHVKDAQNGEFLSFEAGVNRTAAQEANRIIDGYLVGAGDRVKRAWNELLELKGDEEKAQSAMRSAVQGAYVAGDLTDKQAADLLRRYGGVKDKDAAAKVLEYQCERDTGVKYSKLKEAYLDGELTENAAKKALAKYGGKDSEAAEKAVTGWAAEKDTGFALDELKEAYLDGNISRERAIQTRVKYGGVEPEKAEEDALKWDVEKEFGIEYGVQNVQEAVAAGELSEADARTIWTEYGGKSEEDADELIAAANFKAAHSDVDLDDVTASRIQIYEQYAPEGTDAAEFMSYAAQIRKDQNAGKYPGIPDGKGGKKAYSVMDAVAEWINSLPISDGEKTALLLTYTNGKTTSLSRYRWS